MTGSITSYGVKTTALSGSTTYKSIHIFQFINDNKYFNSTHLNTLRSERRALHPNEKPIAAQPLIQDFFAAKRRPKVKIPSTQQLSAWDTNTITTFIKRK